MGVHGAAKAAPRATPEAKPLARAGLLRRLGAWAYDSLLVAGLLLVAGFIGYAVASALLALGLVTVPQGEAALWLLTRHPLSLLYSLWLAAVVCGFYGWFWTQAGQTLGMRAWRVRLQRVDGGRMNWTQVLIRLATSAFGLGNLLCLVNWREPRAFQDIWAECEMVCTDAV
ncbi:MAG: RDD family protein [Aeromonas sp.]